MPGKNITERAATADVSDVVESTIKEDLINLSPASKTRMRKAREYKKRKERKEEENRRESIVLSPLSRTRLRKACEYKRRKELKEKDEKLRMESIAPEPAPVWALDMLKIFENHNQRGNQDDKIHPYEALNVARKDEAPSVTKVHAEVCKWKPKKASSDSFSATLHTAPPCSKRPYLKAASFGVNESIEDLESANLSPASKTRMRKAREYKRRKERMEEELRLESGALQSAPAWALDIFERVGNLVKEVSQLDAALSSETDSSVSVRTIQHVNVS